MWVSEEARGARFPGIGVIVGYEPPNMSRLEQQVLLTAKPPLLPDLQLLSLLPLLPKCGIMQ